MILADAWQVPGFTEQRELGTGRQGRVVLATDDDSGQIVAIKYLAAQLLNDPTHRARFRAEADILARVADEHVAKLFRFVEAEEGAAIIMEAVNGASLRTVLDERQEPFPPEAALVILKGSLLGLATAHAAGVVHRDYKPANVIVQGNGQSKLIDFGIAVLHGDTTKMGTPIYMAPEQFNGAPASPTSDVYSATCVFYECVSGVPPYAASTLPSLAASHLVDPIPVAGVPEPIRPLLFRGMAKDPQDRPPSAAEFVVELEKIAVAAYGPDWERRGLILLAATAAAFAVIFPLAMMTSAAMTHSAVGATSVASTALGQSATQAGTSAGKGLLAKIGGAKGAAGIAVGTVTVAVIAVTFWPREPRVGGEARGSVKVYFGRPGVLLNLPAMPSADSPYMSFEMNVVPARMRAGSRVTVTTDYRAWIPQGLRYLPDGTRQCLGEHPAAGSGTNSAYGFSLGLSQGTEPKGKDRIHFYRGRQPSSDIPKKTGIYVVTDTTQTEKDLPYDGTACGSFKEWHAVSVFTMPDTDELPPGRYQLSPYGPPRFGYASRNHKKIALESTDPQATGALPIITVLS